MNSSENLRRGYAAGVTAFFLWGVLPFYWLTLRGISPGAVVAARTLGSLPLLLALLWWMKKSTLLTALLKQPRIMALHLLSAVLLGANWLIFIYATQSEQIMQSSLGYFLTPLANVLTGALILKERLRRAQWIAVGMAAAGVGIQVCAVGSLPVIALSLAGTFAVYGLVRKLSPADSLQGLAIETAWGAPLAVAWLWLHPVNWSEASPLQIGSLAIAGAVTAVPLLMFASAARRIPMSHLGVLQFLAPTLQFVSAWVTGETLNPLKLAGFAVIWIGCALFIRDSLQAAAARKDAAASESDAAAS